MMKRFAIPALLACAAFSLGNMISQTRSHHLSAAQSKPVARWEHLALTHEDADLGGELATQIQRLGHEGWELVGVTPIDEKGTTVTTRYYFKRSK